MNREPTELLCSLEIQYITGKLLSLLLLDIWYHLWRYGNTFCLVHVNIQLLRRILMQGLPYELLFGILEKWFYCQLLGESSFSIQQALLLLFWGLLKVFVICLSLNQSLFLLCIYSSLLTLLHENWDVYLLLFSI